ncbi:MAG: class I adenylate-forming enzyme family protein, partial [Chitinophagaceae bacterium]
MVTTFPQILSYRANTHPERIAYIFNEEVFSYKIYFEKSLQAAHYLKSLGLQQGDRFGILDLNNPFVIHLISGAMLAGIIPVCINWRALPEELLFVLQDAGIDHLFYGTAFQKLVGATEFPQNLHVHAIEKTGIQNNTIDENGLSSIQIKEDDVCTLLYTSGTTGNPKGVMLTYKNLFICYHSCVSDSPSFGPDTRNLVCGPMYSIFG